MNAHPVVGDRYALVRPLASGGMAEIFLARPQKALAGFEKDIVVKLLKDRYVQDKRVVEMFLEEARIGAQLNHPNIVHVYDVGDHRGQPFIAMELIHGEELSQLCRHGLEQGMFLPVEHAVDLVRQAAEGMGYFQHKRRDDGKALAIVHRDISPSNLLVTSDGVLKIIDFGIAKARTRGGGAMRAEIERLVPGKYNYMSPEQVRGEPVDHRSDIYSLGIVLYEISVGKRLYKGRPEEVMDRIAKGKIKPPTFVRNKFPAALEHIVMRALEPHPEDRYQSAYELANDLEEFLREARLRSGPMRIAQYLDELRAKSGGQRRPELIMQGEAWVDDEGDDVLDFDRSFADVKRESRAAGSSVRPGPAAAREWDEEADDTAETPLPPVPPLPPPSVVQPMGPPPADPAALAPRGPVSGQLAAVAPPSAPAPAPAPAAGGAAAAATSRRASGLLWMLVIVGIVVAAGIGTFLVVR
jgi:serine/threonine-protein kinase